MRSGPHAVHAGHRPARAARAHRALVRHALRPGHRPAAHRRHRRRLGRAAAGLPGAVRGRRRGADARPQLPLQPAFRRRRRRHARGCCRPRPEARFQLDAAGVARALEPRTRAACCWPRRPTPPAPRSRAARWRPSSQAVRARGGVTLVDEIYLGLSYDERLRPQRAGSMGDDVISINSFSKYFSMTGWRLGWLVLPPALVAPVEKLAQNLYICAVDRGAACGAGLLRRRVDRRIRAPPRGVPRAAATSSCRRCRRWACTVPVLPDGAFYAWADCSALQSPAAGTSAST